MGGGREARGALATAGTTLLYIRIRFAAPTHAGPYSIAPHVHARATPSPSPPPTLRSHAALGRAVTRTRARSSGISKPEITHLAWPQASPSNLVSLVASVEHGPITACTTSTGKTGPRRPSPRSWTLRPSGRGARACHVVLRCRISEPTTRASSANNRASFAIKCSNNLGLVDDLVRLLLDELLAPARFP